MLAGSGSSSLLEGSLHSAHIPLFCRPDTEIENAFRVNSAITAYLKARLVARGLASHTNKARSLYLDTANLDLFAAGFTVRDRLGGRTSGGEEFKEVFGLKYRHVVLQDAFDGIARQMPVSPHMRSSFAPFARAEIERGLVYPRDSSELRFGDVPEDIQTPIIEKLGWSQALDLVLKPWFLTVVNREQISCYVDPDQLKLSRGANSAAFELSHIDVLPVPSRAMKARDRHLCFEISLDTCSYIKAPEGTQIRYIFSGEHDAGRVRTREFGTMKTMEFEFKPERSGRNFNMEEFVNSYMGFGMMLYRTARSMPKTSNQIFARAPSKAVGGFGKHPVVAARLQKRFLAARRAAA